METLQQEDTRKTRDVLMRGLFMLLFMIAFSVAQVGMNVMAVVQFLWLLFTGVSNQFLSRFGASLSRWLSEVARFLTCASEEKPFPWKEWPAAD